MRRSPERVPSDRSVPGNIPENTDGDAGRPDQDSPGGGGNPGGRCRLDFVGGRSSERLHRRTSSRARTESSALAACVKKLTSGAEVLNLNRNRNRNRNLNLNLKI